MRSDNKKPEIIIMNTKQTWAILLSTIILFSCTGTKNVQKGFTQNDVLKKMRLANQYFMDKWPDPGKEIVTERARPSNIWTRAVYYEGLMALYEIDPQKKYYDYAVEWGSKHQWDLRDGVETRNADNQCCGQTYIDLYLLDKKQNPERIEKIKPAIDKMVSSDKVDDWWWVDALQMAMPVFVRLGAIYNDTSYFRKMYELYAYTKNTHGDHGLYNPADHLWWRDKDFDPPYKEPNGEDCYWSRGNGWAFVALTRTLSMLPKTDPHYNEYLQDYTDMADALLKLQRPDGVWNVSLRDPTHFGGKETTGTSMFTYGFAWGVNNKILDVKKFRPAIIKAWNGLATAVHENGFLGYVQGTGKEPKDSQPVGYDNVPNFEDFGLGAFLLAGSEVYKVK
jgi:unsaturated rhamnogalacturonyl hydrolase